MVGTRDDLDGVPAVASEDVAGVAGILDGIQSLRGGNPLRLSHAGHHPGLGEAVMSRPTGNDDARRDSPLVFMDTLGDAIEEFGRGVAIAVGWSAENKDGVEILTICVGQRRKGPR